MLEENLFERLKREDSLWPVQEHKMMKKLNGRHKCLVKALGVFPGGTAVKNPPANAEDAGDVCSNPGS